MILAVGGWTVVAVLIGLAFVGACFASLFSGER